MPLGSVHQDVMQAVSKAASIEVGEAAFRHFFTSRFKQTHFHYRGSWGVDPVG
ncbi:MAG: hypothetical protein GY822_28025 [Deltaproteobacteria bacterium]|nr:hypothetical protein [Deltaproteobacteria bacterium]